MHCDGCADRLRQLLEREPGVRDADVSYADGKAIVTYNTHAVTPDRLRTIVERAGYGADVQDR
jgi:copper chaperone